MFSTEAVDKYDERVDVDHPKFRSL